MPQLSAILIAFSLGAMIFFSAVVAPTIFRTIPAEEAGKLLRAVFPNYFLANGVLAVLAGAVAARPLESSVLVICGLTMLAVNYFAIPKINSLRDAVLAGDKTAAKQFNNWHGGAVALNLLEMLGLAAVAFLLLSRP